MSTKGGLSSTSRAPAADSRTVGVPAAFVTLALLTVILVVGLTALHLSTQVVFLLAIVATSLIGVVRGFSLREVEETFVEGCRKSMLVVLILMAVGSVIGSWIVSGIVPSIIYYGLGLLSPSSFLVAGCVVCCLVSFFTGSSYTAVGTLGVAFMGIGYGLGIPVALTAGMVVSGTVFGDKMSPFSDTTNLASAAAGADIFDHIRSMAYTTAPSILLALVLYYFFGHRYSGDTMDLAKVELILQSLRDHFTIHPLLLLIPLVTVVLALRRTPPLVALLTGALCGIAAALASQSQFTPAVVLNSLATGFEMDSGVAEVDALLSRGGMLSMMGTVSLAILALGLGELLQRLGVLSSILGSLRLLILTPGRLVLTTLATCLLTNTLTASQYMAILLPGETLKPAYEKTGVAPRVLSRTLEDGGTIFSYLVPWSMAAIYVSGVLDVAPLRYTPYAFLCVLCPLFAAAYAATGFAIFKVEQDSAIEERKQGVSSRF